MRRISVEQLLNDGWEGIDSDLEYSLTEIGVVYRRIDDNRIEFLIGDGDCDSNMYYRNIIQRDTYEDLLYHHVTDKMLRMLDVTREEMSDFNGMNVYDMNALIDIFVYPYPWEDDEFYILESEES